MGVSTRVFFLSFFLLRTSLFCVSDKIWKLVLVFTIAMEVHTHTHTHLASNKPFTRQKLLIDILCVLFSSRFFSSLPFIHFCSHWANAVEQCNHTAKVETAPFFLVVFFGMVVCRAHAFARAPIALWICDDMERSTVNVIKLFMSQLILTTTLWWFQRGK